MISTAMSIQVHVFVGAHLRSSVVPGGWYCDGSLQGSLFVFSTALVRPWLPQQYLLVSVSSWILAISAAESYDLPEVAV